MKGVNQDSASESANHWPMTEEQTPPHGDAKTPQADSDSDAWGPEWRSNEYQPGKFAESDVVPTMAAERTTAITPSERDDAWDWAERGWFSHGSDERSW